MKKFADVIETLARSVYGIIAVYILAIVLIYATVHNVAEEMLNAPDLIREFALPNPILLIIGIAAVVVLTVGLHAIKSRVDGKEISRFVSKYMILIATLLFLAAKILVSLELMFVTDWDAGYMFLMANAINGGWEVTDPYVSCFPFCIVTLEFLRACIHIGEFFNPNGLVPGLMTVIVVNCIQVAITQLLAYDIVNRLTGSKKLAWVTWACLLVFTGISPWVCIPYTDSMTYMIPTMLLWLYIRTRDGRFMPLKWILIAFLAYWGYRIKGPALLILIAIALTEIMRLMRTGWKEAEKKKTLTTIAGMIAVILISSQLIFPAMIKDTGVQYDADRNVGVKYLIMIGLSPYDHGAFNSNDFELIKAWPDYEMRERYMNETIVKRLSDYGVGGFIHHIASKAVIIYDDATFAWGLEGGFYTEILPQRDAIAPRVRNIFYNSGEHHMAYMTFEQTIWLTILLASLALLIYRPGEKYRDATLVLIMSLAAMFVFTELVEARARYLYTFAPLYLIAGVLGVYAIYRRIRERKEEK